MKSSKRIISVFLTLVMVFGCASVLITANAKQDLTTYEITNPYEGINWETINTYKAALHTHTNASDGDPTLKASVERHSECGFDIVATTDHGTVNYSWINECPNDVIFGALQLVGKSEGNLEYLGTSGTFNNGNNYTVNQVGDDEILSVGSEQKILRVPFGIENNAVSANAHVNGWFADYHNNSLTVYGDAIRGVEKAGGLCVINHPGEYSKARYEIRSEDAYNTDNLAYWYIVNKFARYLSKFESCIGVDINSKGDDRTRFDRILWDKLLERFANNGDNVYCICSSDAHQLNKIDTGFTYILMNNLSSADMKNAMAKGYMIGGSHCIGNPTELEEIATALLELGYGDTKTYTEVKRISDNLKARAAAIENGETDADDKLNDEFRVLDNEGYCTVKNQPMITSIKVDDMTDEITIKAENAYIIRWISNGKLITTTKADGTSFNLSNYSDKIGNYVRAEVFGEGGVLYTQAFILNAGANKGTSKVVDFGFIDFGFIDCLFPMFKNWFDILGRTFANI